MTDSSKINGIDRLAEPLSVDRIAKALETLDISFGVDSDGDLVAHWDGMRVWFMATGSEDTVLRIMAGWSVHPPMRMLPSLLPAINDWNVTKRYPVAVVEQLDDQLLQVLGDMNIDLTAGCTDEFLSRQIQVMVGTSLEFFSHLSGQFPEHVTWYDAETASTDKST